MAVHQREVVEVNYLLPNGSFRPHPVIVISNNEIFEIEEIFYGVMLSTKDSNSEFIFELTDNMMTKPSQRHRSFVKCYLIQAYSEREIIGRHGQIRKAAFEELKAQIIQSLF